MHQERLSSAAIALVWFYAPYSATARRPGVAMRSIVLLRPVAIVTKRSTDRHSCINITLREVGCKHEERSNAN